MCTPIADTVNNADIHNATHKRSLLTVSICLSYNGFFVKKNQTKVININIGNITIPLNVPRLLFSKLSKNTIDDFIYLFTS